MSATNNVTVVTCPSGCTGTGLQPYVWGIGLYYARSAMCRAAIHAGILTDAGGDVKVVFRPGQPAGAFSMANTQHGVTSVSYPDGGDGVTFEFAPAS